MNKKIFLPVIVVLIFIGALAAQYGTLVTFTNGSTEENITFTDETAQNVTRYLDINRYVTVTDFNMSLSGNNHGSYELNGSFETGNDGWDLYVNGNNNATRSNAWAHEGSWSILFNTENGNSWINKTLDLTDITYISIVAYNTSGTSRNGLFIDSVSYDSFLKGTFADGQTFWNVSMINGTHNLYISVGCCGLSSCTEHAYIDEVIFYKNYDDLSYNLEVNNVTSYINTSAINLTAVYDDDVSTCASPDSSGVINETWNVSGISNPYYLWKGVCTSISAWNGNGWDGLTAEPYFGDDEWYHIYDIDGYAIGDLVTLRIVINDEPPPLGCGWYCILTSYCDSDVISVSGSMSPISSGSTTHNPYIEVGTPDGTHEWNYSGYFSTTDSTGNISSALNNVINDGACTGGTLINSIDCRIPFLFHTDYGGTIEWSSLEATTTLVYMKLNFSATTNATLSWSAGGQSWSDVTYLEIPLQNMSLGEVTVTFNEGAQTAKYTNDNVTEITDYLNVQSGDPASQITVNIKVESSGDALEDAYVLIEEAAGGTWQTVTSGYTDDNGEVWLIVDFNNNYKITASKDDYVTESKQMYIPSGFADTIRFNLQKSTTTSVEWLSSIFVNCTGGMPVTLSNQTCYFWAESNNVSNFVIQVFTNSTEYNTTCNGATVCTTTSYGGHNDSWPMNATLWWNGNLEGFLEVEWYDESLKTIEVFWNIDNYTNRQRALFYVIILFISIICGGVVEAKKSGWGILTSAGVVGIVAIAVKDWYLLAATMPVWIFIIGKELGRTMRPTWKDEV